MNDPTAELAAETEPPSRPTRRARLYGYLLIGGVVVCASGIAWVMLMVRCYEIPTGSMEPTIAPGDQVATLNVWRPESYDFRHGQLVIYVADQRLARTPGSKVRYMHRILGVAGDTVRWDRNEFFRNGEKLEEPYILQSAAGFEAPRPDALPAGIAGTSTVPPGHLFVVGDNRAASLDSRYLGSVPLTSVRGIFLFRYNL
ncbi:MAG: signal peptidase I [Planctomycetota bacterium]